MLGKSPPIKYATFCLLGLIYVLSECLAIDWVEEINDVVLFQDVIIRNHVSVSFLTERGTIESDMIHLIVSKGYEPVDYQRTTSIVRSIFHDATSESIKSALLGAPSLLNARATVDSLRRDSSRTIFFRVIAPFFLSCPFKDASMIGCNGPGCNPMYPQLVRMHHLVTKKRMKGIHLERMPTIMLKRSDNPNHYGNKSTFDVHVRVQVTIRPLRQKLQATYVAVAHVRDGGTDEHDAFPFVGAPIEISDDTETIYTDFGLGLFVRQEPRSEWHQGKAVFDWFWSLPTCVTEHTVVK